MLGRERIPRALTIAGSDSGGGAGIQADLKTFAALRVHGMSAITSVTAQNTVGVTGVHDIPPDMIRLQIDTVADDIGIDAAKTGMLHTSEIIAVVAEAVKRHGFPLVVDPVMVAKSGARLLKSEAVRSLTEALLPTATVVTPNAREAEVLSGMKIRSVAEAERAAKEISSLGPKAVVVKGGHVAVGDDAVDVLYYNDGFTLFSRKRVDRKTTHGTGCSFSAAIAAELAKKRSIPDAIKTAKELVSLAIKFGIPIGKGFGPLNPMAHLYREASRYEVWDNVREALRILEGSPEVSKLIPQVRTNIAMATPYAEDISDVVGVPGRLTEVEGRVKASSPPSFGGSLHVARAILTMMGHDPTIRAAMNLRYSEAILDACASLGLTVSSYDRREEPEEIKKMEGMTVPWGIEQAIKKVGKAPDVIYHRGDWGKEPVITIFGRSSVNVAKLAVRIARRLSQGGLDAFKQ